MQGNLLIKLPTETSNVWTNESIDTVGIYSKVSVARATTPNYEEAVANGTLKALPYSLSIDRSCKQPLIVKMTNSSGNSWTSTWPNDWMDDSTTSYKKVCDVIDSRLSDYSKNRDNRVLKKLKGQSLPLIMAWRERKETGDLLLSTANKIADACKVIRHPKQFIRRLYKGNTKGRKLKVMERRAQKAYVHFLKYKKWPKSRKPRVGDLFLQYEFAWKPLIMDIQDALDATAETEKHLAGGHVRVGFMYDTEYTAYGGRAADELELKAVASVRGHQKIYWRVDNTALAAMSQIQSLPETLWDAMPYSFVVDWFVDVSSYLELRNATLGLSFHDGYKSLVIEKRFSSTPRSYKMTSHPYYLIAAQTNWPDRYQFSFTRQILKSFPTPHLMTDFSMPSSLVHIGEAAALVQQALSRRL